VDRFSEILEARQKPSQETLDLVIYILGHLSSTSETEILATQLQLKLEAKLTQEEIEANQQRAR
jgi:hypothetical protein